MIRKFTLIAVSVFLLHFLFVFASNTISSNTAVVNIDEKIVAADPSSDLKKTSLYDSLRLNDLGLSRKAYDFAMSGYRTLLASGKVRNKQVLSIADFSLPSSRKRLFILDLEKSKLLFHTYVSHGRNSGREAANEFSNEDGSFKSSIGFYTTQDTYSGKHGYSLRLNGEEKGFNDRALSRGIVMHSAAYVNESLIKTQGYIGRSQGCPAVSENLHKSIISKIKSGSCFFIYGTDKYYASHSRLVNKLV
ncbi:murein L,D-transpeptidase catalytic domain family protein [Segetibacter sp. 3557_3]|nr:murein L,D-transpeptidase catalytic domain family protein [Segetibacter sp. 3557_3]